MVVSLAANNAYVYWTDKNDIWVVYGCFSGNLKQLEEKVNKKHFKNELYMNQYYKLIKTIKYLTK